MKFSCFTVIQSIFLDNKVLQYAFESEEHNSGGAVAILGQVMSVMIRNSLFHENKAFIGAGLYISLQGSHFETDNNPKVLLVTSSQNETVVAHSMEDFGSGQDSVDESLEAIQESSGEDFNNLEVVENSKYSLRTITAAVENCTFINNTAMRSGGGLMINIDMTSVSSTESIVIAISRSLFRGNRGYLSQSDGGGISIHYYGLMKPHVSITTKIRGTRFYNNGGIYRGGGMFLLYRACEAYTICNVDRRASIAQHASVRLYVQDCHFVSNEATWYAATFAGMHGTALKEGSVLYIEMLNSTISSNRAYTDSGMHLDFYDVNAKEYSSIIVSASNCSFTSNVANTSEAGLSVWLDDCRFQPNSSITLVTAHCYFKANKASTGAGLSVWHKNIVIKANAQWIQQVNNCSFLHNEAQLLGAGFSVVLSQFTLHSGASHETSVTSCTFVGNLAQAQGAGLSINHRRQSSCAFGWIWIVVEDSQFSHNTAFGEGASLYFHLFSWTNVSIISSIFHANRGIYRETIPSCQQFVSEQKTQGGSTTLVTQCQFDENIDTAIMLKSQHIPGILSIRHSTFSNNWCNQSLFAEDIFTDVDLKLHNVTLIDCIFMDQAGSGDEFLELGDKWCMGIVHDVTSPYDI